MPFKDIQAAISFRPDRMNKVNLFESRRFFCDLYCLRPGQSQRIHSHGDNDKVYYIVRGEGKVTIGTESKTLRAGEIACAPAGDPHGISNDSQEDLVCLVYMAPHPSPPE